MENIYLYLLSVMDQPEYTAKAGTPPTKIKLINSGTYGCIFRPGVNCSGNPENTKYVTKIQKSKRGIHNEWRVSQKILKIPGYSRFFAPVLKQCKVRLSKEHATELHKCYAFHSIPKKEIVSKSLVSTKLRYISGGDLRDHLMSKVPQNRFFTELWKTHSYILKAVQKLISHGIVHYDLKDNNILFDTELNAPIIIDFGLSFSKKDLIPDNYENVFFTFADYSYWCIDIVACCYIFNVIGYSHSKTELVQKHQLLEILEVFLYGTDIANVENKYIQNDAYIISYLDSDSKRKEFKKKYETYFDEFLDKSWWNMYETLIQFIDTWDNYSIAVIYAKLLDKAYLANPVSYATHSNKHGDALNKYIAGLERILYAMPDERISVMEMEKYIPK